MKPPAALIAALAIALISSRAEALHYPGEGRRTTTRDFSADAQRFELPNGLIVLLAPDRGFSNVLVWTTFRAGTPYEPAGRSGLAHLVATLRDRNGLTRTGRVHASSAGGMRVRSSPVRR